MLFTTSMVYGKYLTLRLNMMPFYILPLSMILGAVQGSIIAVFATRRFHLEGLPKLGVFVGCFLVGVVISFWEITAVIRLCRRK
jgi:hypothetical protein